MSDTTSLASCLSNATTSKGTFAFGSWFSVRCVLWWALLTSPEVFAPPSASFRSAINSL